jgi:arylsulfatase A-like enzyme
MRLSHSCLLIFAAILVFSLLTGLQTSMPLAAPWRAHLQALAETLCVALGAALLFAALHRRWGLRLLFTLGLTLALLWLVVDQLFYAAYFQHLQVDLRLAGGLRINRLADSLWRRLDGVFVFNLLLWMGVTALLWRQLLPPQGTMPRPGWLLGAAALVLLLTTTPATGAQHPYLALVAGLWRSPGANLPAADDPTLNLDMLRFGQRTPDRASEEALLAYAATRRPPGGRAPNLIYIILESVGTHNLLPGGAPDPAVTPTLHRLLPHIVLFPALYGPLPGSERAHWAIQTGGVVYTQGDAPAGKGASYGGPTLVGELAAQGYQAGLFSAAFMDSENFRAVYDGLPFAATLFPEDEPVVYAKTHLVNSWGIDEREVLRRALAWVDAAPTAAPFFLLLLTSNTHHPYSTPKGLAKPFAGEADLAHYHNALHFADGVLGRLVEELARRGLLDNTLLLLSGDHGEAFGRPHPTHFLHGGQLYEETMRNFLLLVDFRFAGGPLVSQRQGGLGDIMPTLLGLAGAVSPPVPGQDLLAAVHRPRIHYFQTQLPPLRWGLVDGQWKYIGLQSGHSPELYDLAADPGEQHNLAALFPRRIALYNRLLGYWRLRADREFSAR